MFVYLSLLKLRLKGHWTSDFCTNNFHSGSFVCLVFIIFLIQTSFYVFDSTLIWIFFPVITYVLCTIGVLNVLLRGASHILLGARVDQRMRHELLIICFVILVQWIKSWFMLHIVYPFFHKQKWPRMYFYFLYYKIVFLSVVVYAAHTKPEK